MTRQGQSFLDLTALPEIGSLLLAPNPAWLWSVSTGAVLWANAAGAALAGARSIGALLDAESESDFVALNIGDLSRDIDESTPQMRQLPAGKGGPDDKLWCLCSRMSLSDGTDALLAVATDEGGGAQPLSIRAGRFVQSVASEDVAAALTRRDGRIIAASEGFAELRDAAFNLAALAGEISTGRARLNKRKQSLGAKSRIAGAAAISTPDGEFILVLVGPAELPMAGPEGPGVAERNTKAVLAEQGSEAATPVPRPTGSRSGQFTFSLGPDLEFTAVSDELAKAVGPSNADIVGQSWDEVSTRLILDPSGSISRALASRDTWSGVTVRWPTASGGTVAADLTAIPSFRNGGGFEGFRGFGVVRLDGGIVQPTQSPEPDTKREETAASESNVVRLPSATRTRNEALSGDEQDAFRRIAEALRSIGGRTANDQTNKNSSGALVSPADAPAPPKDVPIRLLDRLPVGIVVFREKAVLFANRILLDRLGYASTAAFASAGGVDALFADGPADVDDADYRAALKSSDGSLVIAESHLYLVPWEGGQATMLSVRDPAAQSKTEPGDQGATLARIGELEAVLDTATDGTLVIDRGGSILSLNQAAEALFGIDAADALGRHFTFLLAEESQRPANDYLDGLAQNGVASVLNDGREVIGKVPNGGLIPLFMTIGRLSEGGRFCAVLRDLTQWKNAEEELVAARRSAEIASQQKSDFLAKISHEIRTPLNAIIGFSELMLEERFGPIGADRYREYLKDIRLSSRHLLSLINDLLDLSKIEAGHLDLTFKAVPINLVIQESVAMMQPDANRRRIIIRTSLSDDVPQVVADERSLRQIALNVLSNAVKFNVAGGQVIVSTALEDGKVELRIRDTGIGMSEKEIEAAMRPFQQIANSGPARFEGTGLGLPLTKALVEANRAAFVIDSTPSEGTMVRISFPTERVLQN
ncbi:MAG: histidine kinase dimerization/phospho-acceptor domain-containing protein [Alphaproteobacteria bacterium]